MNELTEKLNGFLEAAAGVVQEYAPQVADAALLVVRIDAIFSLALSVALIAGYSLYARLLIRTEWTNNGSSAEILKVIGGCFLAVAAIPLSVQGGMFGILYVYNWIAAFDPMLGLVYKAAQSAGLL